MVRKKQQVGGALTSLFSSKQQETAGAAPPPCRSSSSPSWQWPSCSQPRTLSFRHEQRGEEEETTAVAKLQGYRTMNSAYFPDSGAGSCFSGSFASVESFSTAMEEAAASAAPAGAGGAADEAEAEAVVRALRSDRLFFDGPAAPCILAASKPTKNKAVDDDDDAGDDGNDDMAAVAATAFGGATAMTVESRDPYRDFRESMEEMVLSGHGGGGGGGKDWRWLEEMLGWYLRANGKATHGLIVGAFVDLLVSLSAAASPSSSSSTPTNFSSASTDCDSSSSL